MEYDTIKDTRTVPVVYAAIVAVQDELSKIGIAKTKVNEQQKFKFRGIDDVLNALSPLLSKHHICILPKVILREVSATPGANGRVLTSVVVQVAYDFVSSIDGSSHRVTTYGEANDYSDKATNKAMSAAYKYAAFQTFCIPTEETASDADLHTIDKPVIVDIKKITATIKKAKSIDQIRQALRQAAQGGIDGEELEELREAATTRKMEIQGEASSSEAGDT